MSSDYVVYSVYGVRLTRGVSLLMMRPLGAKVDHVDVVTVRRSRYYREKRLVSSRFGLSSQRSVERCSYCRQFGLFLVDPARLVLMERHTGPQVGQRAGSLREVD